MTRRWLSLSCAVGAAALAACSQDTPTTPTPVPSESASQTLLTGSGQISDDWIGGPLKGAIFTTLPFGQAVNANVQYNRKIEVYLDGGPRNPNSLAAGLNDGLYVFQITDPAGKNLLSQDPARCRVVQIKGGVIQGTVPANRIPNLGAANDSWGETGRNATRACHVQSTEPDGASLAGQHDTNVDSDGGGGFTVQMMPFLDTPNPGGVYKAWITPLAVYVQKAGNTSALNAIPAPAGGQKTGNAPDPGFKNPSRQNVKTDNFKVLEKPPFIVVKKFVDGAEVTTWKWVTAFELLENEWNGKGWTDQVPASFAMSIGGGRQLACESYPAAAYKFVSATLDGQPATPVTGGTPAVPTVDEEGNPAVCIEVPQFASATTATVVFNNETLKPDLSIVKTPDGQVVDAGDALAFSMVVSNSGAAGTGTAKGVKLSDPLPIGTASGWTTASAKCQIIGGPWPAQQSLECDIGDVAPGASFSASVSSSTSFAFCTKYDNTATASATNHGNVSDDGDITCRKPALSIVKTPDAQTVKAGDALAFSVVVSNSSAAGTGTAKGVSLSDPLPTGTAAPWSTSSPNCSIAGTYPAQQTLNCAIGDMTPGASFSASVSSSTSFAFCTKYDNTATASATNHGNVSDNGDITCLIQWKGETATGQGFAWSATNGAPANWFMYTPWTAISSPNGANLIAGQFFTAGKITGTQGNSPNSTSITITLNAGFRFAGAAGNVKIHPMSCTTNQNYVQPGGFSVHRTAAVSANSITVSGLANAECYGLHVDVERALP